MKNNQCRLIGLFCLIVTAVLLQFAGSVQSAEMVLSLARPEIRYADGGRQNFLLGRVNANAEAAIQDVMISKVDLALTNSGTSYPSNITCEVNGMRISENAVNPDSDGVISLSTTNFVVTRGTTVSIFIRADIPVGVVRGDTVSIAVGPNTPFAGMGMSLNNTNVVDLFTVTPSYGIAAFQGPDDISIVEVLRGSKMLLYVVGPPQSYYFEWTPSLDGTNTVWTPMSANGVVDGYVFAVDQSRVTNHSMRFYRAVKP